MTDLLFEALISVYWESHDKELFVAITTFFIFFTTFFLSFATISIHFWTTFFVLVTTFFVLVTTPLITSAGRLTTFATKSKLTRTYSDHTNEKNCQIDSRPWANCLIQSLTEFEMSNSSNYHHDCKSSTSKSKKHTKSKSQSPQQHNCTSDKTSHSRHETTKSHATNTIPHFNTSKKHWCTMDSYQQTYTNTDDQKSFVFTRTTTFHVKNW